MTRTYNTLRTVSTVLSLVLAGLVPGLASTSASAQTRVFVPLMSLPEGGPTISGNGVGFRIPSLDGLAVKDSRFDLVTEPLDTVWEDSWGARSRLRLAIDGTVRGQLELRPDAFSYSSPLGSLRQGTRVELVSSDWNKLCREEHTPLDHLDRAASGLSIMLDDSKAPRLPAIETLLGQLAPKGEPLTILTARGIQSDWNLAWATALADGWALRDLDREPLIESTPVPRKDRSSFALLPGVDLDALPDSVNVLMGTVDELSPFVSNRILSEVKGPFVTVMRLPGTQLRSLIIASGPGEREVLQAARALGTPGRTWANASFENLAADAPVKLPVATQSREPNIWGPDQAGDEPVRITFAELGRGTAALNFWDAPLSLPIIASDENRNTADLTTSIDMAYGPGLSKDSAWTAHVNRRLMAALPLSAPGGERLQAKLQVKSAELRNGFNELLLTPGLKDGNNNRCTNPHAIEATLFGNSSVEIPYIGGGRLRSSLANWTYTGRMRPSDAPKATEWRLVSNGDPVASAALTLWARQVQRAKAPMNGARMTWGRSALSSDVVLFGTHQDVSDILSGAELGETTKPFELPVPPPPAPTGWKKLAGELGVSQLAGTVQASFSGSISADPRNAIFGKLAERTDLADHAVLMGWSRPAGGSVVALSAPSVEDLKHETTALIAPAQWYGITGDIAIVDTANSAVRTVSVPEGASIPSEKKADNVVSQVTGSLADMAQNAPLAAALALLMIVTTIGLVIRGSFNSGRIRDAETEENL